MIIILMTLEVSFMLLEYSITLLENINRSGITHDNRHIHIFIVQATGLMFNLYNSASNLPLNITLG